MLEFDTIIHDVLNILIRKKKKKILKTKSSKNCHPKEIKYYNTPHCICEFNIKYTINRQLSNDNLQNMYSEFNNKHCVKFANL